MKWTAAIWDSIAASYPYIQIIDSREAIGCRTITKCEVPLVRGDWFIAVASRPPLYHELLKLPQTDAALERLLHVDVAKNIRERKAVRAGFARSGVSQNNRLIERHDSERISHISTHTPYNAGRRVRRRSARRFSCGVEQPHRKSHKYLTLFSSYFWQNLDVSEIASL